MNLPLSVAIITFNEESNIKRCLKSVQSIASEIIVVDSGSKDNTVKIAKEMNAICIYKEWSGHVTQKNYSLEICSQPWILSIDADEVVSYELQNSIQHLFSNNLPICTGYYINRKNYYLGEWINHAWYPEWRLRLVKKNCAQWEGLNPHDRLVVSGQTRKLSGDLYHYSYNDLKEHFVRTIHYAKIGAESAAQSNKRFHPLKLILSPIWRFLRILVLKSGWRDGWRGFIIAFSSLLACFAKYAFLYEHHITHYHRLFFYNDKNKKDNFED